MAREFMINVEANAREVADLLSEVGGKVFREAQVSTTNKQMSKARTSIRKAIASESGVPSKLISKRMKLTRANKRVRRAVLFIGTMPIAAIKLSPKKLIKGVSYRGPGGRVKNKSAFIQTMSSGHEGVFQRRRGSRLPVDEQRVPIIKAARRAVEHQISSVLPKEHGRIFNGEFNFRVGRAIDRRRLRGP